MTDEELKDLASRLVIRRKADGRAVYDEQAKAELVAEAGRRGRSVSRLARDCGINANQVTRWLREDREHRRSFVPVRRPGPPPNPFAPLTIEAPAAEPVNPLMSIQARLPNGVVIDLRECDLAVGADAEMSHRAGAPPSHLYTVRDKAGKGR